MPAIRAIAHPCRCLCLGLRLQITRMTPRRVMTLQCSQMGLTLERTFNGPSPRKIPIEPRSIDGPVSPRKGRDYDRLRPDSARLRCAAQLRQRPLPSLQSESQEQGLALQLRRAGDHIATRQLDELLPRLHFADHGD